MTSNLRDTALVMYMFTLDTNIQDLITQSTQAGSMCLNDTVMQYAGKTMNMRPTAKQKLPTDGFVYCDFPCTASLLIQYLYLYLFENLLSSGYLYFCGLQTRDV